MPHQDKSQKCYLDLAINLEWPLMYFPYYIIDRKSGVFHTQVEIDASNKSVQMHVSTESEFTDDPTLAVSA